MNDENGIWRLSGVELMEGLNEQLDPVEPVGPDSRWTGCTFLNRVAMRTINGDLRFTTSHQASSMFKHSVGSAIQAFFEVALFGYRLAI